MVDGCDESRLPARRDVRDGRAIELAPIEVFGAGPEPRHRRGKVLRRRGVEVLEGPFGVRRARLASTPAGVPVRGRRPLPVLLRSRLLPPSLERLVRVEAMRRERVRHSLPLAGGGQRQARAAQREAGRAPAFLGVSRGVERAREHPVRKRFFNPTQRRSTLGHLSPTDFERQAQPA